MRITLVRGPTVQRVRRRRPEVGRRHFLLREPARDFGEPEAHAQFLDFLDKTHKSPAYEPVEGSRIHQSNALSFAFPATREKRSQAPEFRPV